ncbi:TPA: hypothetical protein ACSP21_001632 [Aeromonas veronii]
MMVDLKVMAYFKISLSTRNWDRAIKLTTVTDLLIDYLSRLIRSYCPSYYASDLSIADATIGLQTGIAKWKTDDHHRRE